MISNTIYRPWGNLDWLLGKIPARKWDYLGCLSTEIRCLTTVSFLNDNKLLGNATLFEIIDPTDTSTHKSLRNDNRVIIEKLGAKIAIENHLLLEPLNLIVESLREFLKNSNGSVILDISCFPKRFFFPIVKFIIRDYELNDLIITYTSPNSYSSDNLSDNPQPWITLPAFKSDDEDGTEIAIVGVGFMPLGLPDVLGSDGHKRKQVNLFFPFPPGPPFYQRTWNFVKEISEYRLIQGRELIRIDAMNIPEVFDKICAITEQGEKKVLFAPFGPKTFSLAMCLHACQSNSSVYYTQPMYYNPDYSEGVGDILGYGIILNKKNLYKL